MPMGAARSTQLIMTSITCSIAPKKLVILSRASGWIRVVAIANSSTKNTSGSMASPAAAAIGLDGMIDRRKSDSVGVTVALGGALPSADLNASAAAEGIGQSRSSRGTSNAAMIVESQSSATNKITD